MRWQRPEHIGSTALKLRLPRCDLIGMNVELLGKLPNRSIALHGGKRHHKTIADFRKDNGTAIRKVCAQFVVLCRQMGLLTKASVGAQLGRLHQSQPDCGLGSESRASRGAGCLDVFAGGQLIGRTLANRNREDLAGAGTRQRSTRLSSSSDRLGVR